MKYNTECSLSLNILSEDFSIDLKKSGKFTGFFYALFSWEYRFFDQFAGYWGRLQGSPFEWPQRWY